MNQLVDKNIIKGIFLIILAEYGSFVAETVGCGTQKFLSENVLAKQFIIIMIIYFSINFTSDTNVNPTINIIKALVVWCGFLMFNKMDLTFTIVAFLLLVAVYVIDNYNQYYKIQKKNTDNLDKIEQVIFIVIAVITVLGFSIYLSNKYVEYKDVWSNIDFIFGKNICSSMVK
jgi:hypothetical protein